MKNYTITVNGNVYNVTVEEGTTNGVIQAAVPKAAAPVPAAPKAEKAEASGVGEVKVTASVPGKVLRVEASVGQKVKAGDNIVILESMKMEIPVVAPQDGTVVSIDTKDGAAVETGDILATMN